MNTMMRMRECATLILIGIVSLSATAQVRPFVEEGKTWTMETRGGYVMFDPSQPSTFAHYVLQGDTVIAGRTWKKLHFINDEGKRTLASALYEENERVYFLPYAGATEGRLLYDFHPTMEGIYTFYNSDSWSRLPSEEKYYRETAIGSLKLYGTEALETAGHSLQVYKFVFTEHEEYDPHSPTYIEGVGSVYGPLLFSPLLGGSMHVVECSVADEKIYEASLWVDPTGIESVAVGESTDGAVYDLSGRRLERIPARGLYIRNGRKILAK